MKTLKLIKSVIAFAFIVTFSGPSWADWQVKAEDDAFAGKDTVKLLGALSTDVGVMYECKGGELAVHYLEKNDLADYIQNGASVGEMAIKVDSNEPIVFQDVHLYRHNQNFISIRSYDKASIIQSLKLLKSAKVGVVAGVRLTSGKKLSSTGDFHQASKAVSSFTQLCDIKL